MVHATEVADAELRLIRSAGEPGARGTADGL
jgi:hypothetical protein